MPCNAVSRRLDTHIQRLRTAITSNHLRAAAPHSYTAVMRNSRLIRRLSRTIAVDGYALRVPRPTNKIEITTCALSRPRRATREKNRVNKAQRDISLLIA